MRINPSYPNSLGICNFNFILVSNDTDIAHKIQAMSYLNDQPIHLDEQLVYPYSNSNFAIEPTGDRFWFIMNDDPLTSVNIYPSDGINSLIIETKNYYMLNPIFPV